MKLDARQIEGFLRNPTATVVLLHGEDAGLVRERGTALVKAVAGSTDDPFRVVELGRELAESIGDEMASIPMTGGRRVVRVRDAIDGMTAVVQRVLDAAPAGFLVLEAVDLPSRGKLRALVEKAKNGAAIACYSLSGRALEDEIRAVLATHNVTVEADALAWLGAHLGADQGVTRQEVEKLALYAGDGGRVDQATARLCVGDLSGLSLDDALFSAIVGDVAGTDRALELAMAEGASPVGVLRIALHHVRKLERARAAMAGGMSAAEATKATRPPLYFNKATAFTQALGIWSETALADACTRLWEAERACKRTAAPTETICRNAVIGLAQRGLAARRR